MFQKHTCTWFLNKLFIVLRNCKRKKWSCKLLLQLQRNFTTTMYL